MTMSMLNTHKYKHSPSVQFMGGRIRLEFNIFRANGRRLHKCCSCILRNCQKAGFPSKPHQTCFALKPMKENLAWESDDEPNKTNEPKDNKNVTFQNVRG